MRRRIPRVPRLRRPPGGWLPLLLVLLAVAGTFVYGVVGNKVAEALPEPSTGVLIVLVVGFTLLVAGLAVWQTRMDTQADTGGVDPRNRARLLVHARTRADGQLNQALHNVVLLELGLLTRPDIVEFPTELLVRRVGDEIAHPVPTGQPLGAIFDQLDQAMLILGAPGSGKTTLLNQLASTLAARAEHDPTQPIPMVLNLASWAARRPPLDAWLADELSVIYGVNRKLGANLITAGMLLPLLDGLDEVPTDDRDACVQAINDYQAVRAQVEGRLVPLVVCSRLAEAKALTTPLRLAGAVSIEPPTDQQVTGYLEAVGAPGVLEAVLADPELSEWLRSPLTLSIIALAPDTATLLREPAERRMAALLDAYVTTMLTPPAQGGRRRPALNKWNPDQGRAWLAWLARSMTEHDLSEFYLERLQPIWLRASLARRVVWAAPCLVGALLGTLGGVLGTLMGGRWGAGPFYLLQNALGHGPTNILVGTVVGASIGLLVISESKQIQPVEAFQWSWRGTVFGGLRGALFAVLVGGPVVVLGGALSGGLLALLGGALFAVLFAVLSGGLRAGVSRTAMQPNEGIHRSARHGVLFGALFAVLGGVPAGLMVRTLPNELGSERSAIVSLLTVVVIGGLVFAFAGGAAVVQHYTLRLLLFWSKATPRRYVRFLEAAVDGLLLRRVGGGYRFPHRLLQDRFTAYPPATPTAPTVAQPILRPRERIEAP